MPFLSSAAKFPSEVVANAKRGVIQIRKDKSNTDNFLIMVITSKTSDGFIIYCKIEKSIPLSQNKMKVSQILEESVL